MPSPRAFLRAAVWTQAVCTGALRLAGVALLVAVVALCGALLAVRYVVFPQIEAYRGDIAAALARGLGQPVEIDALDTAWDGWNPKLVVRGLRVRRAGAPDVAPLLDLPRVDLIVAWTSLPTLDLRFKELVVEGPRLAVRRDRAGLLHIAGIEFDPGRTSGDTRLADWLLRQPRLVVKDAVIAWDDDLRNAPQLVLDHVHFRLESRFGRHRFGLRGTPPSDIAAPVDVRGDVRPGPQNDWRKATGKFYVRLDYADIAAWDAWLPFPATIGSGKGALRFWLDVAAGEVTDVTADVELAAVTAALAAGLPPLDLVSLSGRAGWRAAPPRREFRANALAFVTTGGQRLGPADIALTLRDEGGGKGASGLLEFDRLELAPLAELALHLPIPDRARSELERHSARGAVARGRVLWEGPADAPTGYSATADFSDLGVAARGAVPGLRGLAGRVELTQDTGTLRVSSRGAAIELPDLYAQPVPLDTLTADVAWERKGDRTTVRVGRLEFANRDAAGRVSGQYRTSPTGPGEIDLTAQLTRAEADAVHRYLPRAADAAVRDWLRTALAKGTATDVRATVAGNLADFPFVNGKGGEFRVTLKARDVTLAYAAGWPPLTELDADVRIDGARLAVESTRASIGGVPLGRVTAVIANLGAAYPLLEVGGVVSGTTAEVLRFVEQSPVGAMIDHVTAGATAVGDGRLDLKLALPLGDRARNKVAGEYVFKANELRLPGVPLLSKVTGALQFSEAGARAQELEVEVFGGPAKFALAGAGSQVQVTGAGATTVAALRREFNTPYSEMLSGTLDWTLQATVQDNGLAWTLESPLLGSAIDLPAPLGKAAGETVALKVERRANPAQRDEDTLAVTYGHVGRVLVHRTFRGDAPTVDRALVLLGAAASAPARAERPGIWVRGELPELNVDDWLAVRKKGEAAGGSGDGELDVAGIDLAAGSLEVLGRQMNDVTLAARRTRNDWRLELGARELAGTADWTAASADAPNGQLVAHLSRLERPDPGSLKPWRDPTAAGAGPARAAPAAGNPWPALNVVADSYFIRGRDVGRLELIAHPKGSDWLIDKLALANDGGRLSAEGRWIASGRDQQTRIDVMLDLQEPGRFLSRIGFADALRDAPTKVKGKLSWAGAPSDFDYPTLDGMFRIDVGPGRFTKIEPGIGKLLGVLSLQSLPRRITLDFTDVFSEGFAFDSITGDVRVQSGVLRTQNLHLAGPAAKVDIAGEADIAKETQQLTVRVQPALSGGVSAGAALLFLANPLLGAAVGAGSLLAQKVLKDPIEQMFSYDYRITGSWSDPVVASGGTASDSATAHPK